MPGDLDRSYFSRASAEVAAARRASYEPSGCPYSTPSPCLLVRGTPVQWEGHVARTRVPDDGILTRRCKLVSSRHGLLSSAPHRTIPSHLYAERSGDDAR